MSFYLEGKLKFKINNKKIKVGPPIEKYIECIVDFEKVSQDRIGLLKKIIIIKY